MKDKYPNQGRIAIDMPLPSISLKVFIEKSLNDDDFFELALESPLAAMKECNVNIDTSSMVPSDFKTFFGALASLKEVVKEKEIENVTFEKVFGKPAEIRGSIIEAERNQGFFMEWDNRDAFRAQDKCWSTNKTFERDRSGGVKNIAEIVRERVIDETRNRTIRVETQRDLISERFESSETNNHTRTDWTNDASMQSDRRSDAGVNQNFEKDGKRPMDELMNGPLVDAVDIAAISTRLDVASKILK